MLLVCVFFIMEVTEHNNFNLILKLCNFLKNDKNMKLYMQHTSDATKIDYNVNNFLYRTFKSSI